MDSAPRLGVIRNASYSEGSREQIEHLTQVIHNVPMFQLGHDDYAIVPLRDALEEYEEKYHCPGFFTQIYDLDEESFIEHYRPAPREWPEPVSNIR